MLSIYKVIQQRPWVSTRRCKFQSFKPDPGPRPCICPVTRPTLSQTREFSKKTFIFCKNLLRFKNWQPRSEPCLIIHSERKADCRGKKSFPNGQWPVGSGFFSAIEGCCHLHVFYNCTGNISLKQAPPRWDFPMPISPPCCSAQVLSDKRPRPLPSSLVV